MDYGPFLHKDICRYLDSYLGKGSYLATLADVNIFIANLFTTVLRFCIL